MTRTSKGRGSRAGRGRAGSGTRGKDERIEMAGQGEGEHPKAIRRRRPAQARDGVLDSIVQHPLAVQSCLRRGCAVVKLIRRRRQYTARAGGCSTMDRPCLCMQWGNPDAPLGHACFLNWPATAYATAVVRWHGKQAGWRAMAVNGGRTPRGLQRGCSASASGWPAVWIPALAPAPVPVGPCWRRPLHRGLLLRRRGSPRHATPGQGRPLQTGPGLIDRRGGRQGTLMAGGRIARSSRAEDEGGKPGRPHPSRIGACQLARLPARAGRLAIGRHSEATGYGSWHLAAPGDPWRARKSWSEVRTTVNSEQLWLRKRSTCPVCRRGPMPVRG